VAQSLHSPDKLLTPTEQTVSPVLLYANIKTSSEIRGHLETLCLMYSYTNCNHIYIHILPTPLSQYQEPRTVGVIYVRNAFSPLVTPDQLLWCNSLPHYKKAFASNHIKLYQTANLHVLHITLSLPWGPYFIWQLSSDASHYYSAEHVGFRISELR